MNNKLKQIIKEEIKKALKEDEQTVDKGATDKGLRKFAGLPNSEAAIQSVVADLKNVGMGDNRFNALAWVLTQMGVKDTELSSVAQKIKAMSATQAQATQATQTTQTLTR